jgi:hypothetical protein
MGKKKSAYFRTTITVPLNLKKRMDAVKEDVNWSALACRAFEAKLGEIASRKAGKDMKDVVERLRASKRSGEAQSYKEGEVAGREWAKQEAEAGDLERLDRVRAERGLDWGKLFHDPGTFALPATQWVYFHMYPENRGDRSAVKEFWESALGDEREVDDLFVKGFCDGALEVWAEVRDQL